MCYELVRTEAEEVELMNQNIDFHIERLRHKRDHPYDTDSDDDNNDEHDEEDDERRSSINSDINDLKEDKFRCKYSMKFNVLNSTSDSVLIPFDHPPSGIIVEVLDLVSSGWTTPYAYPDTEAQALKKMRGLRQRTAQYLRREVAALCIQRAWREGRSNPEYALCKKRLRDEFENDAVVLK
jgi:hypothetical protein